MSGRDEEDALSFPSQFIKFPLRRQKGESGQHKVSLSPHVFGRPPRDSWQSSVINTTSAEFSRKGDVEQSICYKRTAKKWDGLDLV